MKIANTTILKLLAIVLLTATIIVSAYALSINKPAAPASSSTNEPAVVTSSYEILEPTQWLNKELPILKDIEIDQDLTKGNWLLLLYHHDCPDCQTAIPQYEQMARDLEGNEDFLQIALIEVPPYGHTPASTNSPCILGRLTDAKDWFVVTPTTILLAGGKTQMVWEGKTPDFGAIISNKYLSVLEENCSINRKNDDTYKKYQNTAQN